MSDKQVLKKVFEEKNQALGKLSQIRRLMSGPIKESKEKFGSEPSWNSIIGVDADVISQIDEILNRK